MQVRLKPDTTSMRRVLVLALLSLAADTLAQTPGAPVISGRVLADGTGIPLRRARIELSSR